MTAGPSIAIITLGCAKNEVDSDKMRSRISASGYEMVDDPKRSDLVIVNTCAFLSSAVEESLEVVFDLAGLENDKGRRIKILVAGCMPSRYGEPLGQELHEADGLLRAQDEDAVVEEIERILGKPRPKDAPSKASSRHAASPSAYVKISDGCDRFCSYCMIPHIRGRYRSFSLEQISAEVEELVSEGAKEIVLVGQDTGIWGHDLEEGLDTADLLKSLSGRFPDTWFRLLYIQPEGITEELLDLMASVPNICPYIDMPLQHSQRSVLKKMNRSGSSEEFLDLIARVRSKVPGVMLRTTFMAGFPGETDADFERLMEFAEEAGFDYAAVFAFSPEEGSAAFAMDGQIDDDVRMRRAQELYDLCESVGTSRVASQAGSRCTVLIEGYEATDAGLEALGRTQGQAPEVDGQVHIPVASEDELPVGSFADVTLTGSFFYELEGEL